jgi:hypothetical protein
MTWLRRLAERIALGACTLSLLAGVPDAAGTVHFGKSHALVIGISEYANTAWPSLTYAEKDARAIATFLRRQDFRVIELYNAEATRAAIIGAMEDVLPGRIGKGDRVVLFYSGHGHTRNFEGVDYGYIVPHDAGPGTGSMIAMDTLNTWSQKISAARHQLFLMDACFGGLLAPKASAMPSVARDHPAYIREIVRRDARQYLTAGGRDQQVLDGGPKGYSYFTGYLLEALQDGFGDIDGDGYITASELASYLIPRATNRYQTPGAGTLPGHGLGDFVFAAPGAGGSRPSGDMAEEDRTKGAPQSAGLPPSDMSSSGAAPGGPATRGPGVADIVAERTDEARLAMQRLLRESGQGMLSTAHVRQFRILRVIEDDRERALLEIEYYAVNRLAKVYKLDRTIVDARLEDGRIVFKDAP